mmetsp:Transcript_8920/g.25109  ORF Transcript_8920/g.25109 Transcript_8920/m.25109 type:complete len:83 (-) Transcript_8920:418-666(-)
MMHHSVRWKRISQIIHIIPVLSSSHNKNVNSKNDISIIFIQYRYRPNTKRNDTDLFTIDVYWSAIGLGCNEKRWKHPQHEKM